MRNILLIIFVLTFGLNNCEAGELIPKPKIVKINEKYYKVKDDGTILPLYGIVLNIFAPNLKNDIISLTKDILTDLFTEKKINIVDSKLGNREDVEVINVNANDIDKDGNIEFSSSCEDHDNDGEADGITEYVEYENNQDGLENLVDFELKYIDKFYSGDIDGDGDDN